MTDFSKTIRPFTMPTHSGGAVSVFCKITLKGGRLSITGVEGPKRNGDCYGSCGQIDMHEWQILELAPGWTLDMVARFRAIWNEWHLNDMRAYSPEMKAAGWHDLATVPAWGYEFTLTRESLAAKKAAETAAQEALKAGQTFTPTAEQSAAAVMPYSLTIWTRDCEPGEHPHTMPNGFAPEAPAGYERARHIGGHASGNVKAPERKTLGWLKPSEHPDGLLGRKVNPDDSKGYGGQWWREEVPADVLAWLQALPDADRAPAWV